MASRDLEIPLQCTCCNESFTGPVPAEQHFQSAAHKKKEALSKQSAVGQVGAIMCDICNITCHTVMILRQHEASPRHLAMAERKQQFTKAARQVGQGEQQSTDTSGYNPERNVISELQNRKVGNKEYDFDGIRGFCYLCDIELSSLQHATQHLNGSKHKKKQVIPALMGLRQTGIAPGNYTASLSNARVNLEQQNTHDVVETANIQDALSKPLQTGKIDDKLYCDICGITTETQESMIDHLKSSKHIANLVNKNIQLSRSTSLGSVTDTIYPPDVNPNDYVSYRETNKRLSALGITHNEEVNYSNEDTLKKEPVYEHLKEGCKFGIDLINLKDDSLFSEGSFNACSSNINYTEGQENDAIVAKPFSMATNNQLATNISDIRRDGQMMLLPSVPTNGKKVKTSRSLSVPYPTEFTKNNIQSTPNPLMNNLGHPVGVGRGMLSLSNKIKPVQLMTKINNLDDDMVLRADENVDASGQFDSFIAKPFVTDSVNQYDDILAKPISPEEESRNPFESIVAKNFYLEPNESESVMNNSSTETYKPGSQLDINTTQYIGYLSAVDLPCDDRAGLNMPRLSHNGWSSVLPAQEDAERGYVIDYSFNRGHCTICDISLTSKEHMEQHLGGRKHKNAKLLKSGRPVQNLCNADLTCSICLVAFSGLEQKEMHSKSDKHKKKAEQKVGTVQSQFYFCEICKVECSGEANYKQHLIGEKHRKKMMTGGCSLNSQQQLLIHQQSVNANTSTNTELLQPFKTHLPISGTNFVTENAENQVLSICHGELRHRQTATPLEEFLSLELFPKEVVDNCDNLNANNLPEDKFTADPGTFTTPQITTDRPVQIQPRFAPLPAEGENTNTEGNNRSIGEADKGESSGNGAKRSSGSDLAFAVRSKGVQRSSASNRVDPSHMNDKATPTIEGSNSSTYEKTNKLNLDNSGMNPFAKTHPYYCNTCKAPANTRESYESHLQGKRHLSKVGTEPAPDRHHFVARQLGTGFKPRTKSEPRNYQWELYENAMRNDTVCFLPTGTGKTMVSVMLMSTMLEMFPTRPVLFVVDKDLLVLQQSKYITEELGEFHFPRYNPDSESLQELVRRNLKIATLCMDQQSTQGVPLWKHDIIVVTAAFCQYLLEKAIIKWKDFSLIVFDEAHHCDKKHLFNILLYRNHLPLHGVSYRPKILGLTASPAGKDTVPATVNMLEKLLANMGGISMNIVQKHKKTLAKFQSNAQIIIRPQPDQFDEIIALFIAELQVYLVYCYLRLVPISNIQFYVNWKNFVNPSSDAEAVRNCAKACIEENLDTFQLGLLNVESKDVKDKYNVRNLSKHTESICMTLNSLIEGGVPCAIEEITELEKEEYNFEFAKSFHLPCGRLQAIYNNMRATLETGRMKEQQFWSHISRLVEELTNSLDIDWSQAGAVKPMALVLVKERDTVHKITRILQTNEVLQRMNLRVASVVGHGKTGASDAAGMNVNQQKRILEEIKQFKYQVIIATSVAEEGVDWPECELVVSMYPPSSLTALVQMRGRARKKNSKFVVLCSSDVERQNIEELKQKEKNMMIASEHLFQRSLKPQ